MISKLRQAYLAPASVRTYDAKFEHWKRFTELFERDPNILDTENAEMFVAYLLEFTTIKAIYLD